MQIFYLGGDPRMYCEGWRKVNGERGNLEKDLLIGGLLLWELELSLVGEPLRVCRTHLRIVSQMAKEAGMLIHQLSCFVG